MFIYSSQKSPSVIRSNTDMSLCDVLYQTFPYIYPYTCIDLQAVTTIYVSLTGNVVDEYSLNKSRIDTHHTQTRLNSKSHTSNDKLQFRQTKLFQTPWSGCKETTSSKESVIYSYRGIIHCDIPECHHRTLVPRLTICCPIGFSGEVRYKLKTRSGRRQSIDPMILHLANKCSCKAVNVHFARKLG